MPDMVTFSQTAASHGRICPDSPGVAWVVYRLGGGRSVQGGLVGPEHGFLA